MKWSFERSVAREVSRLDPNEFDRHPWRFAVLAATILAAIVGLALSTDFTPFEAAFGALVFWTMAFLFFGLWGLIRGRTRSPNATESPGLNAARARRKSRSLLVPHLRSTSISRITEWAKAHPRRWSLTLAPVGALFIFTVEILRGRSVGVAAILAVSAFGLLALFWVLFPPKDRKGNGFGS